MRNTLKICIRATQIVLFLSLPSQSLPPSSMILVVSHSHREPCKRDAHSTAYIPNKQHLRTFHFVRFLLAPLLSLSSLYLHHFNLSIRYIFCKLQKWKKHPNLTLTVLKRTFFFSFSTFFSLGTLKSFLFHLLSNFSSCVLLIFFCFMYNLKWMSRLML